LHIAFILQYKIKLKTTDKLPKKHTSLYSFLKQQSKGIYVAPLGHIILISSQLDLLLHFNAACSAEKQ
jgi:hypothetical protein